MKLSIKDFFSKCDQIRRKLRKHLLKKSLVEDFIFCAVQTSLKQTNQISFKEMGSFQLAGVIQPSFTYFAVWRFFEFVRIVFSKIIYFSFYFFS